MSKGITQTEYENEVETQADHLAEAATEAVEAGEYGEYRSAVVDLSVDVLDGHDWFSRADHGPADHGAIVEYADDQGVDPVRYRDLTHFAESEDPAAVVEKFAYVAFEAHVIETARERGRGGV